VKPKRPTVGKEKLGKALMVLLGSIVMRQKGGRLSGRNSLVGKAECVCMSRNQKFNKFYSIYAVVIFLAKGLYVEI
jgi:ribosomal protein L27